MKNNVVYLLDMDSKAMFTLDARAKVPKMILLGTYVENIYTLEARWPHG